jgi:hypothetical protein
MRLALLGVAVIAITVLVLQTGSAQAPSEPIKVRGCLSGAGTDESPWVLRGAVLPAPPAPAAPAGGGRGDGGGRGGAAAGGRGGGGGAAPGAPAGGGRGGDGNRGGPPPAAAAAPATPAQPPVDLRLTTIDMTPWRNMYVEVEGTLGPRPNTGLREFRVNVARSAYGDCR